MIMVMVNYSNVDKTMPFLPPMTGNGKHTTYKNGDDWGIVYLFFHINPFSHSIFQHHKKP